jgi:hypothetical protein
MERVLGLDDPFPVVSKLLDRSDPLVRAFALDAVRRLAATARIRREQVRTLLEHHVDDPDADVRQMAIDHTTDLFGPEPQVMARLQRQARASDPQQSLHAAAAIWRLVDLRDPEVVRTLDAVEHGAAVPFVRHHARAASYVAREDAAGLAREIEEHSHDATPALVAAAIRIGGPEILKALWSASEEYSKDPCLSEWQKALRTIQARDA